MEQAIEMTEVLVKCAEQVATSLRGLRNGLDFGAQLVEIHRLENDADRIQRSAIADLFVAGIDPMIVIRWKDIFDTLESAVDACETVANVLEGMTLKRAHCPNGVRPRLAKGGRRGLRGRGRAGSRRRRALRRARRGRRG